jgi:hypothetical protein
MYAHTRTQSHVDSGETVHTLKVSGAPTTLAWAPSQSRYVLAYAGESMDRYGRPDGSVLLQSFYPGL